MHQLQFKSALSLSSHARFLLLCHLRWTAGRKQGRLKAPPRLPDTSAQGGEWPTSDMTFNLCAAPFQSDRDGGRGPAGEALGKDELGGPVGLDGFGFCVSTLASREIC